jgi:hypothetical protein
MNLIQTIGNLELSAPALSPENMRLIQLALYYDFVLHNMQQKPFRVLLVTSGGAIMNAERGTKLTLPNIGFVVNTVNELHNSLVECLSDKTKCNADALRNNIEHLKHDVYTSKKINEFKSRGKKTPAELYDLLNPGDGDINVAMQNAVRQIKKYPDAADTVYMAADEVLNLISNGAAVQFLDNDTVAAMLSITDDGIKLPPKMKGGRMKRRGTQRRGAQRSGAQRRGAQRNTRRSSCKNKKRTRTR